jgi:multicomponent K+:H+ antiporter subunit D
LLIAAVGLEPRQLAAAMYYLLHSTLIGAALFLLVDVLAARRGEAADRLVPSTPLSHPAMFGGLFLLAGMAMVGLPPLSGFVGKIIILDAVRGMPLAVLLWLTILGTSLLLLLAYARAGSTLFWKPALVGPVTALGRPLRAAPVVIIGCLLASTAALSAFGGPVMAAMDATAREVLTPEKYISAVLKPSERR